jgi:hypothetical protein
VSDTELIEAVATALRSYATSPLADCEVHCWDQIGYEDADGSVVVAFGSCTQTPEAIGEQLDDAIALDITGYIGHADTETNRRNCESLCKQIANVLRLNRQISAGGEIARTNAQEPITWEYGFVGEGANAMRYCNVRVTYHKTPDTAA